MSTKHSKVSGVADTANPANVRPSDWNAAHVGTNIHDHTDSDSGSAVDHTNLTSIGTNTHAQIDTFIANPIAGSAIMTTTTGSVVKHDVSAITAGSYSAVIVDAYGHVIDGSTTGTGDLSSIAGSAIMTTTTGSVVKHDVSAVTAGSYASVIVDIYGHVLSGSEVASYDVAQDTLIDWNSGSISANSSLIGYIQGSIVEIETTGSAQDDLITANSASIVAIETAGSLLNDQVTWNSGSIVAVETAGSLLNDQVTWNSGSIVAIETAGSLMLTAIAGSAIMTTTTGSVVKHDVSAVTAGSYSSVIVDTYGHVLSGSQVASGATTIAGSAIMTTTTGSVVKHDVSAVTAGSYASVIVDIYGHVLSGSEVASYDVAQDTLIDWNSGSISANSSLIGYIQGSIVEIETAGSLLNDQVVWNSGSIVAIETAGSLLKEQVVWNSGSIVAIETAGSLMLIEIAGSAIMTTTAGSVVKHDVSAITAGSYSSVIVDTYGHVLSGSQVVAGATTIAGSAILSDTSGSVAKHNVSAVTAGSYSSVIVDTYGHVLSGSQVVAGATTIAGSAILSDTSGSVAKHNVSAVTAGSYASVIVDTYGHVLSGSKIDSRIINQNSLINPGFAVAQRGTAFTAATVPLNSDDTYLLDRWVLLSDGNDIVDVSQLAVTSDENPFAIQALVATANKKFGFIQILETKDSPQIDQVVSLSFRAKTTGAAIRNVRAAVISWDGAADTVTSDVVSAWEAEGTVPTLVANWTYENVATDNLLTAAYQTFTIENIAVDTAATKNVGVFIWVDDADAAANDILQIQWVKLELGATCTDFVARPIGAEKDLCLRYFQFLPKWFGSWWATSTTSATVSGPFPVSMRITPTGTLIVGANAVVDPGIQFRNVTVATLNADSEGGYIDLTTQAVAANQRPCMWTPNGQVNLDAEL